MSDEQHFLRALLGSPEDNTLRLAFADWLTERDDPRGTFLRLEVARHETAPGATSHDLNEQLAQARRGLDAHWLALIDRPQPGWRIVRTNHGTKIYGKAIPTFIHNGSYHLSEVDVYADGAINCWGYVDLPLFRDKLAQGWVVPRAKIGGNASIHNLGGARVLAADWDRTPADIEHEVTEVIRTLNAEMADLVDMQGTDAELRDGIRYAKGAGWGQAKPYRITATGDEVPGGQLPVLEVVEGGYRLRRWLIYADGLSQLGYANELRPLEAVGQMFAEGRLALSVPAGAWVILDGLGRFQAGEGYWGIPPAERLRAAADLLTQLNGGPSVVGRCIAALRGYRADPSRERKAALRAAYEAVPTHMRRFCGDMDSKDGPIRRILARTEDETDPE